MPEHGLSERPQYPDDDIPPDLCIDIQSLEERIRDQHQREQRSQESAIKAEQWLSNLLAQTEQSHTELKRIADAAEQRAKLAEQKAASARNDARFSKTISVLALLVSMCSLVVAVLSFIFR